jgi:hypothetical protein
MAQCRKFDVDASNSDAIIGLAGKLYYFDTGSIYSSADPFASIGAADSHLRGYLDATRSGFDPSRRVRDAVASAARYNGTVGGKIIVVSNATPKVKSRTVSHVA